MGRKTKPLTKFDIDNTKPREKEYTLSDGHGLQLRIMPNGKTKSWRQLYSHPITGKPQKITLGTYPELSLANARKKSSNIRSLVVQGIDPKEYAKTKVLEHDARYKNTLLKVAQEWIEVKRSQVSNDHANDIWRSLELHVFQNLGNTPIADLTPPAAIKALKPLASKGSLETVKRVAQRLNEIMVFAVNTGYIQDNRLKTIKSAFTPPKKKNLPALELSELPELMHKIANANIKLLTRYLLEFQLHTMVRPREAAFAKWDEIDFVNEVWTIPASRMKMKKEHKVPLSEEVIILLDKISEISGLREYIFPADRNPKSHMNEQTANAALARMGFKGRTVAHGFRALASTTLNEQGVYPPDVIEKALSHGDTDKVREAYNRTDYFRIRTEMMQWWSSHIVEASKGYSSASVTQLNYY
ncbi:TPA: tyrosine-type recombinase/integrase [Vibrio vulnificus]|nr:tyrosine-type recombinase/integrase [Vibrio vulnificus]HDY7581013.1 tyrosine-type recombinase/integrase [Vibrio vulnificus]